MKKQKSKNKNSKLIAIECATCFWSFNFKNSLYCSMKVQDRNNPKESGLTSSVVDCLWFREIEEGGKDKKGGAK